MRSGGERLGARGDESGAIARRCWRRAGCASSRGDASAQPQRELLMSVQVLWTRDPLARRGGRYGGYVELTRPPHFGMFCRSGKRGGVPIWSMPPISAMPPAASQRLVRAVHCGCTDMLQRFLRPFDVYHTGTNAGAMALAHRGTRWTCLGRGRCIWMGCAARGRDALVLAQHRHHGPELTALRPPTFPLLLENRAYASMAERVWVSGGVDEHHTRPGHAHGTTHSPASITRASPAPNAIWAAFHPEITWKRQPLAPPAAP